jgi:phosphoadenosine phosphosulfate reductase
LRAVGALSSSAPDLDVASANRLLVAMTPAERISWGVKTFGEHAVLMSSMQRSASVLMHMLGMLGFENEVLFVDTGLHFPETLALRDRFAAQYGLRVVTLVPEQTPEQQLAAHGGELWRSVDGQKLCCELRKQAPFVDYMRARGHRLAMVGLRSEESGNRQRLRPLMHDTRIDGYTLHPLCDWSEEDVRGYLRRHEVPVHPLHERGYPSIGCRCCTTPVGVGEDPRAGRWRHLRRDGEGPRFCAITAIDDGATNVNPERREVLTVVVPCLNEERSIEATVADIESHRQSLPVDLRLVLVNDGSTDGTEEAMRRLAAQHDNVTVRSHARNMGIGRSVLAAYEDVPAGSWVTVVPGDNEFYFSSIEGFLALRDRFDLILGYVQNGVVRSLRRRFASHVYATAVRSAYGLPFRYLNGMKLYKVEVFKGIEVRSSGHAYNAELIAKSILRNPFLRVAEAPFVLRGRRSGSSRAFRPDAIVKALAEFLRGRRSVNAYRREILGIKD